MFVFGPHRIELRQMQRRQCVYTDKIWLLVLRKTHAIVLIRLKCLSEKNDTCSVFDGRALLSTLGECTSDLIYGPKGVVVKRSD